MKISHDPSASRYEHVGKGLRRSDLDHDPIKQFGNWFTAAIEAGIRDVNAMSLATAGANGRPSVRIVLLKGFDQDGFVFFTNYESEKGCEAGCSVMCAYRPSAIDNAPLATVRSVVAGLVKRSARRA